MRYKAGHKAEARARMVAAAGRGFRRKGFGGIGVDGLAKEAQVTSGAFYGHFPSKEAAFGEAVVAGINDLRSGVAFMQQTHADGWLEPFVDFYLTEKLTCDLSESCAAQSLTPEVARADDELKHRFQEGMRTVVEQIASGFRGESQQRRREKAWTLISILTGAVTMARAVPDPSIRGIVVNGARTAALGLAHQESD